MIRFCDKEICCVNEDEMDRQQIIDYFLNVNRKEPVCILDEKGKFAGIITYSSILGCELQQAITTESIVLGQTTWEEGRKCFERCPVEFGGVTMIPVIDKEGNLLCFAYQDDEANRELRMLDELMEYKSALTFSDVYPDYSYVTIYGCNELAYAFVMYLHEFGIPVSVKGELWKYIINSNVVREEVECQLDFKCYEVYAEGTKPKEEWIESRQSISSEFECVDKIYEKNVLEGIIADAEYALEDFLQILRTKFVGILGTGKGSLNAYDALLKHNVEICCFVTENIDVQGKKIFGIPVFGRKQVEMIWKDIVFVESDKKNSAWGFGQTDICSYLGYKRNKRFFLLKDYMEIPANGYENILMHKIKISLGRTVLAGDIWLSFKLKQILDRLTEHDDQIVFCDIFGKYKESKNMLKQIAVNEIQKEDYCLLLFPGYYGCFLDHAASVLYRESLLTDYKKELEKSGIVDVVEYPFDDARFMDCLEIKEECDYGEKSIFIPNRILLAQINSHSGNVFFSQILEGHPNIVMIPYSYLSSNLYSICIRLAMIPSSAILQMFWSLYIDEEKRFIQKCIEELFIQKDEFDKYMLEFLQKKTWFTSWELFVIIHVAFAKMQGREINDISKITIYWEPHYVYGDQREKYARWLDNVRSSGFIVNIVRNACVRAGSLLNASDGCDYDVLRKVMGVLMMPNEEKKKYQNWQRIVLKFENLKCNSDEELRLFCQTVGIDWSDKLLEKRSIAGSVNIFKLDPVYRTWEKYLSSFDRFRICLITGPWQKEYGYPYEKSLNFDFRELQELFEKKFRFEEDWIFMNEEMEMKYLQWRRKMIRDYLQNVHRKEILGESGDGVEQNEIQNCSVCVN